LSRFFHTSTANLFITRCSSTEDQEQNWPIQQLLFDEPKVCEQEQLLHDFRAADSLREIAAAAARIESSQQTAYINETLEEAGTYNHPFRQLLGKTNVDIPRNERRGHSGSMRIIPPEGPQEGQSSGTRTMKSDPPSQGQPCKTKEGCTFICVNGCLTTVPYDLI
jgi:hypothetical protein